MGYPGTFVCGVWFGNDDYQSTNRMTGGSLPAMTWHNIMAYAHEGIELKQLPGVAVPQVRQPQAMAEATTKKKSDAPAIPPRPALLTKRGADALVRVERLMDDANRALGGPTSSSTIGPVPNPSRSPFWNRNPSSITRARRSASRSSCGPPPHPRRSSPMRGE